MITLTGQREIARCGVYRDDTDDLAFYVMPQSPRIAADDTGKPIFSIIQYRRDVSSLPEAERASRLGGGIVTLSVELSPTDAEMSEIRRTIAGDPGLATRLEQGTYRNWWLNEIRRDTGQLAAALKISSVPIVEGTVGIAILAETADGGEFVTKLVGAGRVSMTGRQRAAFMAKLTVEGGILLGEAVERDLPVIRVQYDLTFHHRLDAVRMVVWADARKSFNATQDQWQHLTDDASWSERHSGNSSHYTYWHEETNNARNRMFSVIRASETTRVEIIPEAGPETVTPDQINELTKIGNEMVKDFLASTFLEYKPGAEARFDEKPEVKTELATHSGRKYGHHGIDQYNLKTWDESMNANLDYQFKSKAVLVGHLAPQDNLTSLLGGRPIDQFRTHIDLESDFYKYLDVQILCTADFEREPVEAVKAKLSYHGQGQHGEIHEVKEMVFRKDSAPGRFSTYLAAPTQRTYDYTYEVLYKGGQQSFRGNGKHDGDILVLDTDSLGILKVDVQAGLVDWTRVSQVAVKMWYGTGAERKETTFTLDPQHPSRTWLEVIGKPVDSPYTYELTFVDKNNQRIQVDPAQSRLKELPINQPFEDQLEVVVVPAGLGDLLSQVVVALKYEDRPHDHVVEETFTFTASKPTPEVWKVLLRDKNVRNYKYAVTALYTDAVTREDAWRNGDKPVLVVGDPFGFRVQISPYLLKNPPWEFATIHLSFRDSQEGISAEKDLEIRDFSKPLFWRFRTGAPERHTYKYQLTLFKQQGPPIEMDETEYSREVLVLRPPVV